MILLYNRKLRYITKNIALGMRPEEVGYVLSATKTNYTKICFMKWSKQFSRYNSVTHCDSCLRMHVKLVRQSYACEIVVWQFRTNPKRFCKTKYTILQLTWRVIWLSNLPHRLHFCIEIIEGHMKYHLKECN